MHDLIDSEEFLVVLNLVASDGYDLVVAWLLRIASVFVASTYFRRGWRSATHVVCYQDACFIKFDVAFLVVYLYLMVVIVFKPWVFLCRLVIF